jgi:hypothetical protein
MSLDKGGHSWDSTSPLRFFGSPGVAMSLDPREMLGPRITSILFVFWSLHKDFHL